MDSVALAGLSNPQNQKQVKSRGTGLSPKNASFLKAMQMQAEAEEKAAGTDWDQRVERQKKWAELREELWMYQQIRESQQNQRTEIGPDGKPLPKTEGVPAAFLLSLLL